MPQDDYGKRKSVGYPLWAWILGALTLLPLVPMFVGKFVPSTRRYLGFWSISFGSVSFVVLLIVVIAVSVPDDGRSSRRSDSSPSVTLTPRTISADTIELILLAISENFEVLDAALSQDGSDVSLVLVVSPLTSEYRARELGENFVRLTKAMSPDTPPRQEIGFGMYSYLVGVYYPDETLVVLGAKVQSSDRITW